LKYESRERNIDLGKKKQVKKTLLMMQFFKKIKILIIDSRLKKMKKKPESNLVNILNPWLET
jgi:hypothetical protein